MRSQLIVDIGSPCIQGRLKFRGEMRLRETAGQVESPLGFGIDIVCKLLIIELVPNNHALCKGRLQACRRGP